MTELNTLQQEFENLIDQLDSLKSINELTTRNSDATTALLNGIEGFITDVTDQKRAEQALRESEARYRMLVDHLPEPVLVHDGRTIRFGNPACAAFLGAPPAASSTSCTPSLARRSAAPSQRSCGGGPPPSPRR